MAARVVSRPSGDRRTDEKNTSMSATSPPNQVRPLPRAPKLSTKRKILFSAVCLFLALLVCEAGLRVRAWIKYGAANTAGSDEMCTIDPESGRRINRPGYEVEGTRHSIKINSLGFRGEEITQPKPRRTLRIACLGASTTFCTGVSSNEAAWPHVLQERLQKKHPEIAVQVINAGVGGWGIADTRDNLCQRVLPLEPDLVILYHANNDLARDTRKLAQERGLIGAEEGNISPTVKFLSSYSLLFDLVYKNSKILLGRFDKKSGKLNGIPKDLPKRFRAELEAIHDELHSRHIPFVLATFITKYRRDQERSVQLANADVAFYYTPWMSIDDLLDGMDYYNAAIVKFARSRGVPVVEDRDYIPPDSKHFVDCIHLADDGCSLLADRFLRFLEEKKLLESAIEKLQWE